MDRLNIIIFEGVQNLPIFAARRQGYFEAQDITVDITFTPDSGTLRKGLAEGRYVIAHTAVDNAIAMVELTGHDVAVVLGGDNGFNAMFVQPYIRSLADLRGKTVLVDAPNTAFALVLYQILENHGLGRDDYAVELVGATPFRLDRMRKDPRAAAAIMNLPYRLQGEQAGLKRICEVTSEIGPYLSTSGFVLRKWAAANRGQLERYITAYVRGLRWGLDPANRTAAITLLAEELRLDHTTASASYDIAVDRVAGFARDADIDHAGLANVLKLRAHIEGQWNGQAPPPERYIDDSFRQSALRGLAF